VIMGATVSQHAMGARGEEQLVRLAGSVAIPFADPYWHDLLLSSFSEPLIRHSPEEVEARLRPHCQQLCECARWQCIAQLPQSCTRHLNSPLCPPRLCGRSGVQPHQPQLPGAGAAHGGAASRGV
jgi:hypothetical protein